MNRSRYVNRPIDKIDRAIIGALTESGRMTVRELAEQIGLSSPSVTERINKLKDAGAIQGFTVVVDPKVFGLGIAAHVRMRAMPGEVKRVAQMLIDTPEVVEADRVTGEDCFLAKVVVCDVQELETVIDRFLPFSSADTAIIQSSTVVRRLPKL
jgi:Lrp/AsnC family transcriptional regulator, leucine-responsive regulatory protein